MALIFEEPEKARAIINSLMSVRASQCEPCTNPEEVSWFSSSAPSKRSQLKNARVAALTRGVDRRATQSPGALPFRPYGMFAVTQLVAEPQEQSIPRSLAYEMVEPEEMNRPREDEKNAAVGLPQKSRGVRSTPESSRK